VTAAQVDPRRQRAAAIAAQIRPLQGLSFGPNMVPVIQNWLRHYAEIMTQRNGAPPDGLLDTNYAIAEYLAAGGDLSRQREQNAAVSPEFLVLREDAYVSIQEAATMLGLKPDSVRHMCRKGKLDAKQIGRQWFPKLAAVQELKARREKDK